jgi:guanylate kinase
MKPKPIILAIVGASGSGKTTLSLHLQENYNIPAICSYTTRPMREGETDGVEHKFMPENTQPPEPAERLAYTCFGGYHYWTTLEQVDKYRLCTYVIDEKGLLELICNWSQRYKIIAIKVNRPDNDVDTQRLARDKDRVTLSDATYDLVLDNNAELNVFLNESVTHISNLIKHLDSYGTKTR